MAGANGVVIADTWPIVRLGIGRALPSISYRVVEEVGSAAEGAAAVRRLGPRLVICGSNLPDAAVLVQAAKEAGARAVALVDRAGREQLAALATAGADGILVGSSSADELLAAVNRVMAGERVLAPALLPALVGVVQPEPPAAGEALLTEREAEVLACLVRGVRNDEIARRLFMSPATVKTHLNHIYAKLAVSNRHEAMARAIELGLVG